MFSQKRAAYVSSLVSTIVNLRMLLHDTPAHTVSGLPEDKAETLDKGLMERKLDLSGWFTIL